MQTIVLCETLAEAKSMRSSGRFARGTAFRSVGQHPKGFAGLVVAAVYVTPAAKRHSWYPKVAATLQRCARKSATVGDLERLEPA